LDRGRRERLRQGYLKLHAELIDSALDGQPQGVLFCEGVALELYLGDDEELHWREMCLPSATADS
jgi:hypothetical protein